MESTSPCTSLIGYLLKWRCCLLVWYKSHWPNLFETPVCNWITSLAADSVAKEIAAMLLGECFSAQSREHYTSRRWGHQCGRSDPERLPLSIQKEVISNLKHENQFLSKEKWESIWLISRGRLETVVMNSWFLMVGGWNRRLLQKEIMSRQW